MKRSKRFEILEKRKINQDTFFPREEELGLSAMNSRYDPSPGLRMENGKIVEMDGKKEGAFDGIETFIALYGIELDRAEQAMAMEDEEIAKMIVDINVAREDVLKITKALTPAKMLRVVSKLNAVEIMMGQMKMRARRTPANQAIVTNIKDNPALLAADAAEAALRGFAEIETTCAVSRMAPLNAIAILVGSQTGRKGVLTQCSMEESLELKMGLRGLTSYAETVSLYGTEAAMDDGDDTPWSKAFLCSCYASRGIKMRTTSGTGSEVLMGHSSRKSMLYLEILCVYLAKACGAQGVQNGSISCIGIATAVPEGFRAIAAENLVVSLLDMEVASGNDQTFTHSDLRKTAKLLMQMMPGTDFITSGYSATPNFDDVFAGSNTDCDDYDDYYIIQRDMQIDGGIKPITEQEAVSARRSAAQALSCVFEEIGFPEISPEEIEAAVYAYSNEEMPDRDLPRDLEGAKTFMAQKTSAVDLIKALARSGYWDVGESILDLLKQRVSGDYLQTAGILDENFSVVSALNDKNDYSGPGTGYRLEGTRWEILKQKENAVAPENILLGKKEARHEIGRRDRIWDCPGELRLKEMEAIVIAISPAFGAIEKEAALQKQYAAILRKIAEGIEGRGMSCNAIRINHLTDLNSIASLAAEYSRSGIGIGLDAKGSVCIHRKDISEQGGLEYHFNLPLSDAQKYRSIGENAVAYARKKTPGQTAIKMKTAMTNYQIKMICLSESDSDCCRPEKRPNHVLFFRQ